jgi:hypothetical protein
MLKIRKPQHQSLSDKGFIDRLEASIAEDIFGRKVSGEERMRLPIREMVEHGVGVARGYGLVTERDLALFVLNMLTINPEFHRQPRIHGILKDSSLEPPERREKLLTDVSDEEWDEAGKMTDADRYWARVLPPVS